MTRTLLGVALGAVRERGDVYHLHDPELISVGLLLKLLGKRVIYDAHEDLTKQVLAKPWIPAPLRPAVGRFAHWLTAIPNRFFDAVVAATPPIARRFSAARTVVVQNFPIPAELEAPPSADRRPGMLLYVGGITVFRGAHEMVEAVSLVPEELSPRLVLVGEIAAPLRQALERLPGWDRTEAVGWKSRPELHAVLAGASVGLVLVHPLPSYVESYPTKLFEYMSAGLPVIASDFPLWREIVDGASCGLVVDPLSAKAVAEAATWLLTHPKEAREMGRRGAEAVRGTYSWDTEARKLIALYRGLVN